MSENMEVWDALRTPPKEALKKIKGGRLSGMTDISPQWRYKAMTEQFGMCGVGWKYEVVRVFTEAGSDEQVFAFAEVLLFVRLPILGTALDDCAWSDPIPGLGGSMLVAMESKGLYSSDEAFKMAITDALSVAMKMLGVGADIYMGMADGKYADKGTIEPKSGTVGKVEGKADPTKDEIVKKILNICMTIGDGDTEQAGGILYELTHWDEDGEVKREGTRKGNDLRKPIYTLGALKVVYGKAKTALEDRKKSGGVDEKPDVPF